MLRSAFIAISFMAATMLTWPMTANAAGQPACTERTKVLDQLGKKYKEVPVALGLANNGGVIELFSAKEGATWTIIITMPNGMSCMMAAGEDWQTLAAKVAMGPET